MVRRPARLAEHDRLVETKAVDVHVLHPEAEAVHHETQGGGLPQVEGVPAAGPVDVAPRAVSSKPEVGLFVHPGQGTRWAAASLDRVAVANVQDHLDAGTVEGPHHLLELRHLLPEAVGGVTRVRCEEPERAVTPVVGQPQLGEPALGPEVKDRHQLERRHAQ